MHVDCKKKNSALLVWKQVESQQPSDQFFYKENVQAWDVDRFLRIDYV